MTSQTKNILKTVLDILAVIIKSLPEKKKILWPAIFEA